MVFSSCHPQTDQKAPSCTTNMLKGRSSPWGDRPKTSRRHEQSARQRLLRAGLASSRSRCWLPPAPWVCWWRFSRLLMPVYSRRKFGIGRPWPTPMRSGIATAPLVWRSVSGARPSFKLRAEPKPRSTHRVSPIPRMQTQRAAERRGPGQGLGYWIKPFFSA